MKSNRTLRSLVGWLAVLALLTAGGADAGEVDEARELARRLGAARVIVRVDAGTLPEGLLSRPGEVLAQRERIARTSEALLARVAPSHKKNVWRYRYLPLVSVEVTGEGLEQLADAPETVSVWIDRPQPPLLAQSVPLIGGDIAFAQGFEGTGFAVAVLDTGVDAGHPFLSGRVVADACFSTTSGAQGSSSLCPGGASSSTAVGSGMPCPASVAGCNHGTHVAGIAAGNGTSFDGVARDAGIIAVQVFSRFEGQNCGQGPSPCALSFQSDQIRALEHVYSLRGQLSIASVNMSLGGGKFSSACDSAPQKPAIDLLRSAGIATAIASGNDGFGDGISSPACISSAISVGSTTKADQVSSFSNSAGILDLLAPGSAITSSVPGGGFASFSGTSMATPHVAGAFAVLREKAPSASVSELLAALINTGLGVTDSLNGLTRPRIRIDQALAAIGGVATDGALSVTPAAALIASGPEGGPFSGASRVYSLENTGGQSLDFAVQASAAWIQLSLSSGTLAPGATRDLTVSLGAAANSLAPGLATGSVSFQNTTNGDGNTSRSVSLTVMGAAVANDKFANAFLLAADAGTTLASNVAATREPGEPQHAGNPGGRSLWWRWVAPRDGTLAVDTQGSSFDTLLGVYTGNAVDGLTTRASNDDAPAGGTQSDLKLDIVQGTTYRIAVDGFDGASGDVVLSWEYSEENSGLDGLAVTPEAGFLSTGPPGGPFTPTEIVYLLTNTDVSTLTYGISSTASFVTLSSSGGSLSPGESTQLTVSLNAEANSLPPGLNSGLLRIGDEERDVQLVVTSAGLSNDFFAARTQLAGAEVNTSGSNGGASKEAGEPNHAGNAGGASVWWTWTAPATGLVSIATQGSNFDTTLGVYTGGAVASLAGVASNDDSEGTLQSRVSFRAAGGKAYEIAVDGYNGASGSISLAIQAGLPVVSGDSFDDPVVIRDLNQPISATNEGATREAAEPDHAGNAGGASVWFEWTAIGSGFVTVDTLGSNFDTLLAVYTGGSLGSLTLIGENDDFDSGALDVSSLVSFDAVAGETYRFAVDGWGGDQGEIALSFFDSDFPNAIESFEADGLFGNWSTPPSADAGWTFTNATAYDGVWSFQSGLVSNGQVTSLEFSGEFVEGHLRFAFQVDSEPDFDFFFFEIDDVEILFRSGPIAWTRSDLEGIEIPISAGTHTLRWSYEKDGSVDVGADSAWIDAIEFIPEPAQALGSAVALLTILSIARARGRNGRIHDDLQ